MKKTILTLAIAVAVLAVALVGGTIAYLTDSEGKVNTMTVGHVSITQNEQQRPIVDGNYIPAEQATAADFVDFVNGAMMLTPYTGERNPLTQYDNKIDDLWEVFDTEAVDKFVSITNTGEMDAYVRTIIAFEDLNYTDVDGNATSTAAQLIARFAYGDPHNTHTYDLTDPDADNSVFNQEGIVWLTDGLNQENTYYPWIEVGGTNYTVCVVVHPAALAPGATTPYSLMQIMLRNAAQSDDMWWDTIKNGNTRYTTGDAVNGTYDIIVLSQAVQTTGFATACEAFNNAFPLSATDLENWLANAK